MWYPVAVNNESFSGSKTPATRISHGRALDLRIRFMDLIAVIFELSEEREREVGYSSKVLHIERGRSRELCGTSSRDPPLPVVILIRDLLAGRRSLLQEIALRDPVASLSMHGPTAGTTLRLKIPRRSQRAWDLLISHQSIAVLLFYSFMITEKSFSLANLNGGIYFNFTFLRNRM